ncbi:hypothetical protein [Phormidesmis priestleyi]|uniref:hypothetical protein n=1 Tax=Phormidesmis priestleyi TaxID=268141 RepID=UPI00116057DC|nr:hypothetical protein [Phormidesmis priestleyi]
MKTTLLTLLTLASLLAFPRTALADFMANSGSGGYYDKNTSQSYRYEYEVWANNNNTAYTLKVWDSQNYPNGSPYRSSSFESARQALDYFDCHYAQKQDICRQMR